jgi:hypothetical protein
LVVDGIIVVNYFGVFLCITAVGAFKKSSYCRWVWLQVDRLGASMVYNRNMRTISGIVGQRANAGLSTYKVLEYFIDGLAKIAGDSPDHCYRAYMWELDKLDDVYMAFK